MLWYPDLSCPCLDSTRRTEKGHDSVIGTAIYMSPEIMRGADNDDCGVKNSGYGRSTVRPAPCCSASSVMSVASSSSAVSK